MPDFTTTGYIRGLVTYAFIWSRPCIAFYEFKTPKVIQDYGYLIHIQLHINVIWRMVKVCNVQYFDEISSFEKPN